MKRTGICLALVALGDFCFYDRPAGWTAGAYLALLAAVVAALWWKRLARGPALAMLAATAGLAIALLVQPGPLAAGLGILGVVSLALSGRGGWSSEVAPWLRRWASFALAGWFRLTRDAVVWIKYRSSRPHAARLRLRPLAGWIVPVLLSLVFVGLFAAANPVVERGLEAVKSRAVTVFDLIIRSLGPERSLFWIFLGIWIWALLRARDGSLIPARLRAPLPPRLDAPPPGAGVLAGIPAGFLVRCLFLFNLVFLVETTLDVSYLFAGARLPEGMTYAEYAHRGAYPLIATVLLAAVFVLVTFGPGSAGERSPWARRLVHLWIAQNVFLTFTGAWRLILYVQTYHLTRWRLAAAIWFAVVALGLVWICWRIAAGRSNAWLLRANFLTAAAVLYIAAFANFDGWIAWYNVRNCREIGGRGAKIDLRYLEALGEEALPAVDWLRARLGGDPAGAAAAELAVALGGKLERTLEDWRGWSFLRWRIREGRQGAAAGVPARGG